MKWWWQRKDAELDAEIQSHLEMAECDRIERGESAEQARVNARREFGNVGLVKEVTREMWGWAALERLLRDLRYGARTLSRQPGFTLIAVLTLALGIGANTAIFSVVNAVLLRPLPYADDEQLVMIWGKLPAAGVKKLFVSLPEFVDYRDRARSFAQVGVYGAAEFTLTGRGEPERLNGAQVSANLLPLLGVNPVLGSHFMADANQPDQNARVVMLSHVLWQRRFDGDPQIIGQPITLNSLSYTVVGVMPSSYRFPDPEAELWRPIAISAASLSDDERGSHWLRSIARLQPGVTMAQAQAEMDALARTMQLEHPANYEAHSGWGIRLVPLRQELAGDVREGLLVLFVVVGCVLLIACANVANLLLARAAARQREMAVRAALGAGRLRLVRQLLTESMLLALAGGGLGILLALWSNDYLIKLAPLELANSGAISIDGRVLIFTLLVSLLTAVLFGLAPAWQSSKLNLNNALKEEGRSAGGGRGRLRNLLVIGEVAIALTLLVGAGLLLKSFHRLRQVDPGLDPANLLTMKLALSPTDYTDGQQQRTFYEQALKRIEALPGVQAAGAIHNLPLGASGNTRNFSIEGLPEIPLNVNFHQASPHYFSALGMRAVSGRFFTDRDREDQPRVAIINETLARRFFPNQDPLGKRIKLVGAAGSFPWLSIVGVVRDVKQDGLDEETLPALYTPYLQPPLPAWRVQFMFLAVRTQTDPLSLLPALRGTVQALDKNQPVYRVATMEQLLARSIAARKFSTLLLVLFATVALVLSVVGLYSVMAYLVTLRTREIGIRLALGGQKRDVLRLVISQGMRLAFTGVVIGIAGALALTRLMTKLLYGVSATDPVTFGVIALLLIVVTLLACWIPARRATKVDPLVALRCE